MTSDLDRDYYLARINAEREAAERATNDSARAAHLQLANHYQQLLAGAEPHSAAAETEQ
jgi:hypothetical protein